MISDEPLVDIPESRISPDSDEHRILEHYLMLCARTSRVKIVHAWHVGADREFEKHRRIGKQRLFCWVDANNLEDNNAFQDVLRRGFNVPINGMSFSFGSLTLPGFPLLSLGDVHKMADIFPVGERRMFQLILCELG